LRACRLLLALAMAARILSVTSSTRCLPLTMISPKRAVQRALFTAF
jgi:hypothetical protein